jgi:hypothetical protein
MDLAGLDAVGVDAVWVDMVDKARLLLIASVDWFQYPILSILLKGIDPYVVGMWRVTGLLKIRS